MRKTLWASIVILCGLASPARAAGLQFLDASSGLAGAIWYPCASVPSDIPIGPLALPVLDTLRGVKDCPVAGTKLPLVVVSHGRGGSFAGHLGIVEALAEAGFIVAAINHPGDSFDAPADRDAMAVWASRPVHIIRLIDFMLNEWKDRAAIDPARVGFFGFSLGGYTGLVLAGADADFRRLALWCKGNSKLCERARSGDVPKSPPHDPRIRAAVIADAANSFAFAPESLARITIPLQVWRSEFGGHGVVATSTAYTASHLPGSSEIHTVPAGHYAFLAPCSRALADYRPELCSDPPGFDRAAFHREFDARVVAFFRDKLARP